MFGLLLSSSEAYEYVENCAEISKNTEHVC